MPNPSKAHSATGRILKYTGIFGGVQGVYVLLAVLRSKITAELLSTRGIGLINNYNRAVDFIGSATNLGLAFSAVQHISRLNARGNERSITHYVCLVRSWILLAALAGMALTALASPLWSYLYFENFDYVPNFLLLAPLVGVITLSGGEMAVLKGMRRLKSLALISTLGAFVTLLVTTFSYVCAGTNGIVPALLVCGVSVFVLQLCSAHRAVPYVVRLTSWRFLRRGRVMVRLGMAYAVANLIAFGAQSAIHWFIMRHPECAGLSPSLGGSEALGIYGAGFALTMTYSRLIFMSLDAEYYPRLSAAAQNVELQNYAVNRQIDVLVLLISPFLLLLALVLPFLVRLLYTEEFLPAVPLVMGALCCLFFKAVSTPVAYLSLAHARSRIYLWVETCYSVAFVASVSLGYYRFGFFGAGLGFTFSYAFYGLVAWWVYRRRFFFAFEATTLRHGLLQLCCILGGLLCIASPDLLLRYGGGGLFALLSLLYSWRVLSRASRFSRRLRRLFRLRQRQ